MPLFLSTYIKPLVVPLQYVQDSLGNTVAVTIPLDVWNEVLERCKTVLVSDESHYKTSTEINLP